MNVIPSSITALIMGNDVGTLTTNSDRICLILFEIIKNIDLHCVVMSHCQQSSLNFTEFYLPCYPGDRKCDQRLHYDCMK